MSNTMTTGKTSRRAGVRSAMSRGRLSTHVVDLLYSGTMVDIDGQADRYGEMVHVD